MLISYEPSYVFLIVQEDYDTRLGQLQMDIVHLRSAKQQLEHELGCLRYDPKKMRLIQ